MYFYIFIEKYKLFVVFTIYRLFFRCTLLFTKTNLLTKKHTLIYLIEVITVVKIGFLLIKQKENIND